MSAVDLPNGQYYDYTAQSQYVPNSPDTFYGNVIVQPPTRTTSDSTADSANTPPSHTSRSRRTVARPSHSNPQSQSTQSKVYSNVESSDVNMSQGPSTQVRKDRERHLAGTPREALVQLAVRREHEIKKAKQLATTATLQLELARDALTREVEARKVLEDEKYQSSIKTTQAIINAQTESINSQQEIGTYKLQIENLRSELKRAKDVVRAVEEERDKAEQALSRSRSNMRQVKEENVLLLAREEGRREGFEEGLRQGRVGLAPSEPQGDLPKAQRSSHKHRRRSRTPPPSGPSAEERAIYERELMRIKQLLANTESERDTARQNAKNLGRDCQRLQDENGKLLEQRKKLDLELEHERSGRLSAERERETMRKVYEANLKHLEDGKRTSLAVKEKELEELRQELKKHEKEHADAQASAQKEIAVERERVKKLEEEMVRERERERLRGERDLEREKEKEKETAATIAAAAAAAVTAAVGAAKSSASSHRHGSSVKSSPSPAQSPYQRMPYHPMPAPPMVPAPGMPVGIVMPTVSNGVPRAASSGSQRGHGRDRRMSVGSYTSMMTGLPFDMLQLPSDMLRSDLSAIPEDANSRDPSPAKPQVPAPPMWYANGQPPPNYGAQYGSQAPMSMPRAPMDDVAFAGPGPGPGPGGNMGYQTPSNNYPSTFHPTMPVAPGETPATYQPPVTMPTAPGEAPAGYQPPVTMPTAPGEGAPSYKPPLTMPVTPGEGPPTYKPPIAMPTAPGEGPTTYRPPAGIPTAPGDVPGSGAPITMPTAPGEGPSTYQPPVTMPTAPGEAPTSYRPPVNAAAPPGQINNGNAPSLSMPMAPGEGPATYRPPVGYGPSQPGYEPPLSMPKAPGEGPEYHPPPVVPPAPGEAGHQGPIAMPRAPADDIPHTAPVSMPLAPGDVQGYVPPTGMPRAPPDGSGYQPPIAMPRAPADGPDYRPPAGGRDAPIAMPRAPADEMGPGYTPRSHTPSISMPRAPADGPGPTYIPGAPSSTISMHRAPVDGPGSEYIPRSHTPGISMPQAPSEGSGSIYAPPRSHTPSVTMPRAPSDGANSIHGGTRTRTPSIAMPRAPSDSAGSSYAPHKSHPSNGVPRVPSDVAGGAYTPRTRSKSISMPRAPADAPGYIPHSDLSQGSGSGAVGMPRAPSDTLSYTSRSHTAASAPRAPSDGYDRPYTPSVGVPRAPSDGYGRRSRTQTPSISIPHAPSDDIGFVPPVVVQRPPSSAGRRSYHEYGPDQTLLSPNGVSNRNGPVRRPSIGSTGSYEILIHPPSRPHSVLVDNVQDPHSYLSPNHRPIPLPQPQQVQPVVLPIGLDTQRNINPGGTGTQPNSPVVAPFSLPPNFVPQVLTDRNGISTPISSRPAVLPNVIPPRPPSSQGNGIYGNPLSSRGRDSPPTASRSPFIPPAALSSSSPNMRSWDLPPGRAGSGGGATPRSVAAALPGQRTPVPIYGPPLSTTGYPSSARNSPMVMPMPMPTIGGGDEDEDVFDRATRENTRLNEMSMPEPTVPAATGTKKKKKKRG